MQPPSFPLNASANATKRSKFRRNALLIAVIVAAVCVTVFVWAKRTTAIPPRRIIHVGSSVVTSVAFSPDGQTLVTGDWDHKVKVWDMRSGSLRRTLSGHANMVNSVVFSPDGKTVASGSQDAAIILWRVDTGAEIRKMSVGWYVYAVAFSPDGKTLASGSEDGGLRFWDAATGSLVRMLEPTTNSTDDAGMSVAFSGDGRKIAVMTRTANVRVIDTKTGQRLQTFHSNGSGQTVAFSPDGDMIAANGNVPDPRPFGPPKSNGTVRRWRVSTGEAREPLAGHDSLVQALSFSPDGHLLASGSVDGTVRVWDSASGNLKGVLGSIYHGNEFDSVAFSPDSKSLAAGSREGTVEFWDVSSL